MGRIVSRWVRKERELVIMDMCYCTPNLHKLVCRASPSGGILASSIIILPNPICDL